MILPGAAVESGTGASRGEPGDRNGPGSATRIVHADAAVVGSGVAGLSAILALEGLRTVVLTKGSFGASGSTFLAQGGVAAALGEDDAPELHARDTRVAGAGLADPRRVELLTREGPFRIRELVGMGARFDELPQGGAARGLEAMHSTGRVLHAGGDRTGREILRALRESVEALDGLSVEEHAEAVELLVEGGAVRGLRAVDRGGNPLTVRAPAVILASGGPGRLYLSTTNPPDATGDGVAMAARAGAALADLEFVQFHPTALAAEGTDPLPLVSEAVRGEGARLVDGEGRRVMEGRHPAMELAPRDVVARVVATERAAGRPVYLDAREHPGEAFPSRFPEVFRRCREAGIDPRRELIPVASAEHFHMGGVATDDRGRTSLAGLWACGEVAATGVHGANRLASNSLLEGLVFGARAGRDARHRLASGAPGAGALLRPGTLPAPEMGHEPSAGSRPTVGELRAVMEEHVGIVRHRDGLSWAMEVALRAAAPEEAPFSTNGAPSLEASREERERSNLGLLGYLLAASALAREESRGAHQRRDHPEAREGWARRNVVEAPAQLRSAGKGVAGAERDTCGVG